MSRYLLSNCVGGRGGGAWSEHCDCNFPPVVRVITVESCLESEETPLTISQQIVKILTFYNFRLACHNQTKLSLSLLSQAGGVKLRKYLSHIKMIISSIPLANQFPKLILDVIVSLTYIGNWSLPGEILLVCVTMRRGTMRTRRMTMGMKCMGSWQGAIYTRGRWHWPARKRTLHWLDINLISPANKKG